MAVTCQTKLDTNQVRKEIAAIYSQVASNPDGEFHFHRGPEYAASFLGYDPDELATLPDEATASFAGIGNPLANGPLHPGETVLDVGCGAGTDLLLAAKRVGQSGRAIGVDLTPEMRESALRSAAAAGLRNVEVREGTAEDLPVDDASIDVVISNGVLNLVPDKPRAFAEIARVLRPGGRLMIADIAINVELSDEIRNDIDLWTG